MASNLLSFDPVSIQQTIFAADKSAINPHNGAVSPAAISKPMDTNTNTAVASATSTPNIVAPVPMTEVKVDYKKGDKVHNLKLTRFETAGKGEKAAPVAYWGLDPNQFATWDDDGKVTDEQKDTVRSQQVDALASLIGWANVRDMVFAKVNTNLKASQCEQGKDVYTMEQKATYVADYINADFGVNSKGGGQAIKALKEINTKQSSILLQMVQLQAKFASAPPTEAAKILAEIQALALEAAKLVS